MFKTYLLYSPKKSWILYMVFYVLYFILLIENDDGQWRYNFLAIFQKFSLLNVGSDLARITP